MPTQIEWVRNKDGSQGETWNPTTGCSKVSDGCRHCYAEVIAKRFWGKRKFTDVRCHRDRLEKPLHWRNPRRVFVNSMGDLFHRNVPFDFIAAVFGVMAATPEHTYQILTKHPVRMREWFAWAEAIGKHPLVSGTGRIPPGSFVDRAPLDETQHDNARFAPWPIPNVMLGVSVEDQQTADERIPILLRTPAALRFVSVEPMLSCISVWPFVGRFCYCPQGSEPVPCDGWSDGTGCYAGEMPRLDWVIVGCESGPRRRPMHPDWARSIRAQCVSAGVPFFLKQMEDVDGRIVSMPELDGKRWAELPR